MRSRGHEVIAYRANLFRGYDVLRFDSVASYENSPTPHGPQRRLAALLGTALATFGICAHAGSGTAGVASGTTIDSTHPNNNNGGATSIYVGGDVDGAAVRSLIDFAFFQLLATRAIVTNASLTMTTLAPAYASSAPAMVSLEPLSETWGQGNGVGVSPSGDDTWGQPCSFGGATWNQPSCSSLTWSPGGSVSGGVSASASVPATAGAQIVWQGYYGSGMVSDVQGWVDAYGANNGWRLRSSTEPPGGDGLQRFAKSGQLNFSFSCKAGFLDTGSGCTTCTAAADSACVTTQSGNACKDSGPPSTTYSCTCNNAAYIEGPGSTSCFLDLIFKNGFE